jgi:hypothetical protein
VTVLGNSNQIDVDWSHGIGLIIAIATSTLGGVLSGYNLYKKSQ